MPETTSIIRFLAHKGKCKIVQNFERDKDYIHVVAISKFVQVALCSNHLRALRCYYGTNMRLTKLKVAFHQFLLMSL